MSRKIFLLLIVFIGIMGVCLLTLNSNVNASEKILEDGLYTINISSNQNLAVQALETSTENGTQIGISTFNSSLIQKFYVTYLGDGYYQIKSAYSGKVLDVSGASKSNGAKVEYYTWNGTDAQKWSIKSNSDGSYSIVSKCNGLYLDVYAESFNSGNIVQMYSRNGSNAQKFVFKTASEMIASESVSDGVYQIKTSYNTNLSLTIANSSQLNGGNIQVNSSSYLQNQKFRIEQIGTTGYYKITVIASGKVLDVSYAKQSNGTNLQQYTWNGSNAQQWIIKANSNGTYTFISRANHLAIDIVGGFSSEGTNAQVYGQNGSSAQQFKLTKVSEITGTQTIADGLYTINMKSNSGLALQPLMASGANGTQIGISTYNSCLAQKFYITYIGDGYYTIKSAYSGKYLDVYSACGADGTKLDYYTWNDSDAQKWIIKANSDDSYSIISKCNGLYIDILGGSTTSGTVAQLYSGNGSDAQKFIFSETSTITASYTISEGIYIIKPSYDDGKVLTVSSSSKSDGANIEISDNVYGQNQKFRVEKDGDTGYYKLTVIDSAKMLDVSGGDQTNGTNVDQYTFNDTDSQKWIIKDNGDGTYSLISKTNDLYLDIAGGSSSNGANVQVYSSNGSSAQKFTFSLVEIYPEGEFEIETSLNSNKVIDVCGGSTENGTGVQIWDVDNVSQQKFTLKYYSDGQYYVITANHSGKVLTTNSEGTVYQYDYIGELGQKWTIKEAGNGYYYIISNLNGKCLDLTGASTSNGTGIQTYTMNYSSAQKFRFFNGVRNYYESGSFGYSGLAVYGDSRGSSLTYYKYGNGSNVIFLTFSIHGFEDSYNNDGAELTYIAEQLKSYLDSSTDSELFSKWTIYIFPNVNPDGQTYGTTNNGPGRTTLASTISSSTGIDLNRCWQVSGESYVQYTDARNYNGTSGFQAYEAIYLRDFLLANRSTSGQTVLIDVHGWLNETMGDDGLGSYYRSEFGLPTHISSYGRGYLINWARKSLGVTKTARTVLVELPQVYSHEELVSRDFATKFINATVNLMKGIS